MNTYFKTKKIKETYRSALPEPNQAYPPNIKQAFTFIITHLFDPQLTITWTKEQCHISSKSFSNRFYKHINWYPKEFILYHRIEVAKIILQEPEVKVTTIALSTGFSSAASFSNSFKAREGITPSQWREQN